ncbi:hypothetical protein Sango_2706400 [Sesamum angolense]|uniref:Uncharacterized protein n=1 Tax=Sesamum angolense TaxID=2727404 RepID=A0AAE1W396_9LAMI|nr:hypothetical protein Sango_2706400 [Sesamum angolense]
MNVELTLATIQHQLQSIANQLQHYNKNKSIIGEGLTVSLDRGSSSRITAHHTTKMHKAFPNDVYTRGSKSTSSLNPHGGEGTNDGQEGEPEEEDVTISVNAMCGNVSSGTLRVTGVVNGKEILIFFGSGSTHSFLDEKVVKALGIKTELTTPMILGGCDFVLGCDWLRAHNPVELDFHQLTVTISQKDGKVIESSTTESKKKGIENRAADALFRREPESTDGFTYGITTQLPLWMQELQFSYEGDSLFQLVLQAKTLDPQSHPDYKYESGVLRRGNKLCVGNHGEIREIMIKVMHDSALGGHS